MTLNISCMKCHDRIRHIRGCCQRCHAVFRREVRAGLTTWSKLESEGKVLPATVRTKANAWNARR